MHSISEVCDAHAGLRGVVFADMTNVVGYGPGDLPPTPNSAPTFTDTDKLYSIAFERYSAEASGETLSDQGGDTTRLTIRCFIPKSRFEVTSLRRLMRNRLLFVIGIDRYGTQHVISDAIATWRQSTGTRPGTRHGYEVTFTGIEHYIIPSIAGDGDINTAPPVGGGGGDEGGGDSCCITINPTQIAYTPAPTGNPNNRNQMVTTPNGSVYFIDNDGRSIVLNRPAPLYYQADTAGLILSSITLPLSFPIPNPADYAGPTYDEQAEMSIRLWIKHRSRWLHYDHAEGFTVDHGDNQVLFPDGVTGAVEFYLYQEIPPRPL